MRAELQRWFHHCVVHPLRIVAPALGLQLARRFPSYDESPDGDGPFEYSDWRWWWVHHLIGHPLLCLFPPLGGVVHRVSGELM